MPSILPSRPPKALCKNEPAPAARVMKNPKTESFDPNRRKFLGACCASVGATGMLSALAQLRLIGAVASADNGPVEPRVPGIAAAVAPDYKALVCLFLSGGNDANNLLIPTDSSYAAYA